MKPIKPNEIKKQQLENIDPEMIQAVNELLMKEFESYSCSLSQQDIIAKYFELKNLENTTINRKIMFDRKQLNFEPLLEKEGWNVTYDRPGYNETYEASFKFKDKTSKK